jgi:hypothetical protein
MHSQKKLPMFIVFTSTHTHKRIWLTMAFIWSTEQRKEAEDYVRKELERINKLRVFYGVTVTACKGCAWLSLTKEMQRAVVNQQGEKALCCKRCVLHCDDCDVTYLADELADQHRHSQEEKDEDDESKVNPRYRNPGTLDD